MAESKDKILGGIVKGTSVVFIGIFLTYLLRLGFRILASRYLGPESYGMLILGEMILNVGVLFSFMGIGFGIIKFISHYSALKDYSSMGGSFFGAFKIILFLSIISSLLLIFFSAYVSNTLFNNPALVPIVIVFALAIPFNSLVDICNDSLLALKRPGYQAAVSISKNIINILIAVGIIIYGGTILHFSVGYVASFVCAALLGLLFLQKKGYPFFTSTIKPTYKYREIIYFSVPVFLSGITINVMNWADTFFLGVFRPVLEVGVYNTAMPVAASFVIFLTAFAKIFFPIMNELKAKNLITELQDIYSVVLRWIFMISTPVFLFTLIFNKEIISLLFGSEYSAASIVLVILLIPNFINVMTGPTNYLLMTFGKTKLIFYINIIATVLNILLNIFLIPLYGIVGAAFATTISLILREVLLLSMARRFMFFRYEIKTYGKCLIASLTLPLLYSLSDIFISDIFIKILFVLPIYLSIYLLLLLFLQAFNKDDLMVVIAVEKKLGVNLSILKRVMERFL